MTEKELSDLLIAAISAIGAIAGQYGLKRLSYRKNSLELQKEQQEHTDNLYSKVIELQRDSVKYLEEAHNQIKSLKEENMELKRKIEKNNDL